MTFASKSANHAERYDQHYRERRLTAFHSLGGKAEENAMVRLRTAPAHGYLTAVPDTTYLSSHGQYRLAACETGFSINDMASPVLRRALLPSSSDDGIPL